MWITFKLSKENQLKPFAHITPRNFLYIKQLLNGPESCVRYSKNFYGCQFRFHSVTMRDNRYSLNCESI